MNRVGQTASAAGRKVPQQPQPAVPLAAEEDGGGGRLGSQADELFPAVIARGLRRRRPCAFHPLQLDPALFSQPLALELPESGVARR